MTVPYRFNYPLLLGSWQGQALVSLNKLAKAEGLEILDGVGLLETFYARGYPSDLRTSSRQLITRNVYIDQRLLDRRLRALGLPPLKAMRAANGFRHNRHEAEQ
jgi:hypothetical protein